MLYSQCLCISNTVPHTSAICYNWCHKSIFLVHHEILGAVDSITFEAFIVQKLVPNLKKGDWVIMDNCSIHQGKEIKKIIKKAGAKLLDLPTYSPDFNPIENCWSKIKSILRQISARTYPEKLEAIDKRI